MHAVRDVTLTLHRGEVLGLAGESGCGKSTLAYGLTRLLPPPGRDHAAAEVRVPPGRRRPVDVLALSTGRAARVPLGQDVDRVPGRDELAQPGVQGPHSARRRASRRTGRGMSRRARLARARELLKLVGISADRLDGYPHELSGGMRQRVMIAMALALEPQVVIMDEPTTALDVVVQREILRQIIDLREQLGFSVLFITHDLSLLVEISDRIAIMYGGRIVEHAPASELTATRCIPTAMAC